MAGMRHTLAEADERAVVHRAAGCVDEARDRSLAQLRHDLRGKDCGIGPIANPLVDGQLVSCVLCAPELRRATAMGWVPVFCLQGCESLPGRLAPAVGALLP